MSFLAPLFLLGSLAVALPVVFHLIRRTTRERTPFSSLMFLQPSPPRLTRRSRLEHILLLLLRCAVLCLLALGFAWPFIKKPTLGPRQIVLISDLQEGSRLEQLQGYEWPKGIEVSLQQLKARVSSNAGLQLVTSAEEGDTKTDVNVRVRVSNAVESKREQFEIGWGQADGRGFLSKPIDVYVPPGQSRTVPVPAPPGGLAVDRIILQGDDEDFDNTVFVIPPEQARVSVVYFGSDSEYNAHESLYFVKRAFQETRRQAVQVLVRPPNQPLLAKEIDSASLVVVTSSLSDQRARELHQQIAAGKTVLFSLAGPESAPTLARLVNLDNLSAEEAAHPGNYAMLSEIDFRHPLFAPFADPRFSDFTKIHFWKYRRLDAAAIPGARVLAKFDSGDPAIIEVPVGKGRVLVLTSGWRTDDSQLALSTKFVPLLYSLLEQSGTASPIASQYVVGDIVPLTTSAGLKIRIPDGSESNLAATQTNFSQTMTPGIYAVTSAGSPKRFAVNLDPAESRTTPLGTDELERLGVPASRQIPVAAHELQRKTRLENAELESRQKLWRAVLIAAMATLLLESWLAGRAMRRGLTQTPKGPVAA